MKKLLLILFLGLTSLQAMEAPGSDNAEEVVEINLTEPEQSKVGNLMQISALDGKIQAGYITFCLKKDANLWNLLALRVHQEYRNHHIGQALMKECIKYIQSQGATLLVWKALPLDHAINLHTLINIYRRIIESLGYSMDSLTMGPKKGTRVQQVKMRLEL